MEMESSDHQEAIADFIKAASAEISAGEHLPKSLKNDHRKSEKKSAGTLVETGMVNGKPSASYGAKGKNKWKKKKKKKGFRRNFTIQHISSKDVVSGIRMAVIDRSYPDAELCQKQVRLIQSKLVAAIDEATKEASPKFQQTKFDYGILWITCADQSTKEWLERTVPNLQGLWEDASASLTVVEGKDLFSICTQFKVSIPETVEEEVIRSRLEKQNNDLATENWLLMTRRVKEFGQTLVYSLDEQSTKALEQLNFEPYYNLGRITFRTSGVEYNYHGDQAASQ